MIWRFRAAPKELQLLHHGAQAPEWIALVPRALRSQELDAEILRRGRLTQHHTRTGDLVYMGGSNMHQAVRLFSRRWTNH